MLLVTRVCKSKAFHFNVSGNYPLALFQEELKEASEAGIPITCHAGEWPNSIQNIRIAGMFLIVLFIHLLASIGVKRLGHGLVLREDPELMSQIAQAKIAVECCVTANFGTHFFCQF